MKEKINFWLNRRFKAPEGLQVFGLTHVFALRLCFLFITIFDIEISRRILISLLAFEITEVILYLGIFCLVKLVVSILCFCNEKLETAVRGKILTSLLDILLKKNEKLMPINSEEMGVGDKVSISNGDCDRYVDGVMGRVDLVINFLSIPVYVVYGLSLNKWVTILVVLISIVLSFLNKNNQKRMYDCYEEINNKYGAWSNYLWKALDNLEIIRVFLSKEKLIKEHRKRNDSLCEAQNESFIIYLKVSLIEESSDMMFTLLVLVFSFFAVMQGNLALTSIFALMESMSKVQKAVFLIPEQMIKKDELDSISSRITKLLNQEEDFGGENLTEKIQQLVVDNVSFRYPEKEVLKGISCSFEKGKFYILAGESGCGKSTLLKVIAKILPLSGGEVRWNNSNLTTVQRKSLFDRMTYVSQSPFFLEESIKANICVDEVNDDVYSNLIDITGLKDVLEKNESDDSVYIGANGHPLSSGECQMLSFTRVLYNHKEVILLDEVFSALDPAREKKYFEYLKRLTSEGSLVILVSHRLTNFDLADEILYMREGRIVEKGSLEDLMKSDSGFGEWFVSDDEGRIS